MRQRVRKYHNILGPLEAIIIAWWAQSQDNITESLHELDVTNADTSRLGTIFLKFRIIRISGVSVRITLHLHFIDPSVRPVALDVKPVICHNS